MGAKWEAVPAVQELATENQELRKEVTRLRRQQLSRQSAAGAAGVSQNLATASSAGAEPDLGPAATDAIDPLGR